MNAKPRKLSAYLAGVESLVNTSMYVVVVSLPVHFKLNTGNMLLSVFQIKDWQYIIVSD